MIQNDLGLALNNPQMLALLIEQKAQLDRGSRKRVEKFISEMQEIAEKGKAAHDTAAMIQIYSNFKVEQTLTAMALLKVLRGPGLSCSDMEAFEKLAQRLYLETAATIMNNSLTKVIEAADR